MNSLNDILNATPAQPVAGAGAVLPVVGAAPVIPEAPVTSAAPVAGVAAPVIPVTPGVAAPVANNLVGGGNRLANIKNALKVAKVGSSRNDIPLGEGIYLLKSGQYEYKERSGTRLSNFSFICLRGIKDGQGVAPGGPGYTGAIAGSEYTTALFLDGDYATSSILNALAACFRWSKEMVKVMQSDGRLNQTVQLMDAFTCVSSENGQPTGQPCCFSNQIVLQMSSKLNTSEVKVNGQSTYDQQGKAMTKTYTNTYWDKRVPLADACAGLDQAFVIKAFGSAEAVKAAQAMEQQLDAFV